MLFRSDFESHDGMTEERLYQKLFSTHFGHLAIIGLWISGNMFHIAWQGNFEQWVADPLHVRPIAHAIWDPHFGQGAIDAFTQAGASSPVNIAYSGLYHWFYTIGMTTNAELYQGSIFMMILSAWDHVFLGLFWMYNSLSIVIFHFSWKMQSDIWGTVNADGSVAHITNGNFAQSAITINGWLRDYLWAQAVQVINSYGSSTSAYGIMFLGAHFIWAFSLMFLFSGRGYWQELIESIVWAHNKLKVAPAIQPRALSIIQGRAVGVAHYLLGGIATTWAFFHAHILVVG